MEILGALFLFIIVLGIYYGLIPYALMLLANSLFNQDFAFWQIVIIWWFILFITKRIGGNNNNGN